MELVRQPIFLLLMTGSVLFEIFLAVPYYFAFGDEPKLVANSSLAVMLLSGLFGAVMSASSSLAREIRTGTALAVLSKPVGRAQFLLAKFAGLAAALTVLTYVNMIGVLLASRMAFDAYGKTDLPAIEIFGGGILLAYALAGFSNFFLRRPFVSDAVFAMLIFTALAAFLVFQFTKQMESMGTVAVVNWNLLPAGILILFALWILAARGAGLFHPAGHHPDIGDLFGLFSDRPDVGLLFRSARGTGNWWASALYSVIPNWQLFWLADAIETGKNTFQWAYVGKAFAYAVCYAGAALALGTALFEERELS